MTATENNREYVPALGQHWLTPLYDAAIALTTREAKWRKKLLQLVDPGPNDAILDIGCGTGTLLTALRSAEPKATLIGLDPDPEILAIARNKAMQVGGKIEFMEGFGDEVAKKLSGQSVNKITTSLVLHQVPLDGKRSILSAAHECLPPGGRLFIADFGEQRTALMRFFFKSVQRLDGYEYTQPNADGCLPTLMKDVGFTDVLELMVVPTIVGSISLYTAHKSGEVSFG